MVYTGDKKREYDREWRKKHRETQRDYIRNLRLRVIQKLGGKCVNCGCDDIKALELNHKNGGGNKENLLRRQKSLYLDIIAGRRNDIELTCKICNSLHCLVKLKGLENRWEIIYH